MPMKTAPKNTLLRPQRDISGRVDKFTLHRWSGCGLLLERVKAIREMERLKDMRKRASSSHGIDMTKTAIWFRWLIMGKRDKALLIPR